MSSPNLVITHVAASQTQKEVPINAAIDALDNATNREVGVTYADADITLTGDQARRNAVVRCLGSMTANRRLTLPAGRRLLCVVNRTSGGHHVEVGYAAGQRTWVPPQGSVWVQGDGTDVLPIGAAFEVGFFVAGRPDDDELVGAFVFTRRVVLTAGAAGARAHAEVAATATSVCALQRNGVGVGTVAFAASANVGTFSVSSDVVFEPGDRLLLRGPSPQDATLADVAVSVRGRVL